MHMDPSRQFTCEQTHGDLRDSDTQRTHTHTHKHRLLNRPKMPWNNQNTSDICVDYNLATLSIVFKHGLIGCIFVLEHNFLQLEHDSLSKQRRSLTPRSHHVSFTSKLAWPATGGKHRSTLTCLPKTENSKTEERLFLRWLICTGNQGPIRIHSQVKWRFSSRGCFSCCDENTTPGWKC